MDTPDYTLTKLDSRNMEAWPGMADLQHPYSGSLLRPLKKSRAPSCGNGGQLCKVAITLLLLLLLAWGIAVPLYFLLGPGPNLHKRLPHGVAEGQISKYPEAHNGTVLNAANGTMVISNQRYTHHLSNHYSAEYQAIKLKLETLLSVVFNKNSEFNKAAVTRFRPRKGTVEAQFVLIFHKNQPQVRDLVEAHLLNYLAKHWSMLGHYQVDISTLKIHYIRNQCAVDNGGCSHLCFWSILNVGYECRCPQSYQLLGDAKTCFPSVVPKATSTRNPCLEGHFACRSGSCIPHHWLCDGVSDCLLGEDEAGHMCHPSGKMAMPQADVVTLEPEVVHHVDNTDRPLHRTTPVYPHHPPEPAHPQPTDPPRIVWQHQDTNTPPPRDIPLPRLNDGRLLDQSDIPRLSGRPNKFKYFG